MLSIAFSGKDTKLNDKLIEHLKKFYTKKQYKLTIIKETPKFNDKYILNDLLLLKAYNRSITHHKKYLENYDIVFYNGSIIDDYQMIQDSEIPANYVTKINKYYPIHDLYINIGKPIQNPLKVYQLHSIQINDNTFENVVKTIFDNLPRCNWCGKLFKPTKQNYKYCNRTIKGKKCSEWGWLDNNRKNNREYYKRNKENMGNKKKGALGSKGANLHSRADPDPLAELQKVRNAKKALGLKPIK